MKHESTLSVFHNFIKYYTSWELEEIARNTGFTKRISKFQPSTFLKIFTLGLLDIKNPTLEKLASKAKEYQKGLKLTKQAVCDKLGVGARFIELMFNKAIEYAISSAISTRTSHMFCLFSDIQIYDSSIVQLPPNLAAVFKGYGGNNSAAGLKLQVTYSVIRKAVRSIDIQSATNSDRKYIEKMVKMASKNQLVLADLGYYSTKLFKGLVKKGAYFISKVKANTIFSVPYQEKVGKFKRIEICDLLQKASQDKIDTEIYVGGTKDTRMKVRLVGIKLPEQVLNERIRKARQKAKSQGRTLSVKDKEQMHWLLMITNITEQQLPCNAILDAYRLRWQVELLFKTLKGTIDFKFSNNIGEYYLRCLVYGRLIILIMQSTLHSTMNWLMYQKYSLAVSVQRFFGLVQTKISQIVETLTKELVGARKLNKIFKSLARESLFEKRKRKTTEQIMQTYNVFIVLNDLCLA